MPLPSPGALASWSLKAPSFVTDAFPAASELCYYRSNPCFSDHLTLEKCPEFLKCWYHWEVEHLHTGLPWGCGSSVCVLHSGSWQGSALSPGLFGFMVAPIHRKGWATAVFILVKLKPQISKKMFQKTDLPKSGRENAVLPEVSPGQWAGRLAI